MNIAQDRDLSIIKFMQQNGGKTFLEVLERTFFKNRELARKRVDKLVKDELLAKKPLSRLAAPRNMITFGEAAKETIWQEFAEEPKRAKISTTSVNHEVITQIVFYWLAQLNGRVEKTSLNHHYGRMSHVPDLIYYKDGLRYFIEVELSKKSSKRYAEIVTRLQKDEPAAVIYICSNEESCKRFAKSLPRWDRLTFITLDNLIRNIRKDQRIGSVYQASLLLESNDAND